MFVAKQIVSKFCDLSISIGKESNHTYSDNPDCFLTYSKGLITLSLLWLGYHDAIQEGDGERVKRYWKFTLILFKVCNGRNYAIEAAKFLIDNQLLTTRLSTQLKYSRFVNVKGRAGCNIPLDLHMELNTRIVPLKLP